MKGLRDRGLRTFVFACIVLVSNMLALFVCTRAAVGAAGYPMFQTYCWSSVACIAAIATRSAVGLVADGALKELIKKDPK
jgi:hypothetical protein